MNGIFPWLDRLIEALLAFFPRPVNVKVTERMVVFRFGRAREFSPGWRWVWPLIEAAQVIEVVDGVLKMEEQPGWTKDGIGVTIDALIIYSIPDALTTLTATQDFAAMMEAEIWPRVRAHVASNTLEDLTAHLGDEAVDTELAANIRKRLRRNYGVRIHKVRIILGRSTVLHHVGKAWGE